MIKQRLYKENEVLRELLRTHVVVIVEIVAEFIGMPIINSTKSLPFFL